MNADRGSRRVERVSARGFFVRLWLSLCLVLQLAAFGCTGAHAAEPGPPELAALGKVLGVGVSICHHGDGQSPGQPANQGDCGSCPLCHLAHSSAALVPDAVAVEAVRLVSDERPRVERGSVCLSRPLIGASGPRGPPSSL